MIGSARASRRFFAPEIVQTSATDCGPAALASVLVGHGIPADYARLREACQTSVDGTSIDTLEELAQKLGLEAAQYIQTTGDILLAEARNFPALLVTRLPEGGLHFIVAWRRAGDWIQIMDPGTGRSWLHVAALERLLHVHEQRVAADDWREWAAQGPFSVVLRHRLRRLLGRSSERYVDDVVARGGWAELASLDATARVVSRLVKSGAVRRGQGLRPLFSRLYERARAEAVSGGATLPAESWSVRQAAGGAAHELSWRGAVALRLLGRKEAAPRDSLPPELRATVESSARSPLRSVLALVPRERLGVAAMVTLGALTSVFGVVVQALVARALLSMDQLLLLSRQWVVGVLFYALLLLLLVIADTATQLALLRAGRHLEARLWTAILEKVPKLPERYFQSRLVTDMADRAQSVRHLRRLPGFLFEALRVTLDLAVTVVALALADVQSLPVALAAFVGVLLLPLLFGPAVVEREMRLHTHLVALSRFLLDALLGAMPVRSHRAARPLKTEQETLLSEWARASRSAIRVSVALGGADRLVSAGFLILLIYGYLSRHAEVSGGILVVLFWGGRLPLLGAKLVGLAREYPVLRNVSARLVELLSASEAGTRAEAPPPAPLEAEKRGLGITFRDATVKVSGKRLIEGISLEIQAGSHVAVVGRSGAGKSTLLGLLMGWFQPESGEVCVEGRTLEASGIDWLRADVAWVDPAVQLWNSPLLANVRYGSLREPSASALGRAVERAELLDVLERLPEGMQTELGEGGRLLSGGEGQRVRYARALLRPGARLVLLDEPFRGLEREMRADLLKRARALWPKATLICVTHDISETEHFDRVLVMEDGRIAEDGSPARLAEDQSSLYARQLDAERRTRDAVIMAGDWQHFTFVDGRLVATGGDS